MEKGSAVGQIVLTRTIIVQMPVNELISDQRVFMVLRFHARIVGINSLENVIGFLNTIIVLVNV